MSDEQAVLRERQLIVQCRENYKTPNQPASFIEPVGPGLNNFFIVHVAGIRWVGRKLLSVRADGRLHLSSLIKPCMLLGPLTHLIFAECGLTLHFITTSENQKTELFESALLQLDSQLYYPFPVLNSLGQERIIGAQDWVFSEALAHTLNTDEQHFRDHCSDLLAPLIKPGALLFDPACSTGEFIASMARNLPGTCCIGSDSSLSMVEHARAHHALPGLTFHHRAAENMLQTVADCDVLFLRFLNAEVMSRDDAHKLLELLLGQLKKGALAIVFGHTPVLPNIHYHAHTLGLNLRSCVAGASGQPALFECYVLES